MTVAGHKRMPAERALLPVLIAGLAVSVWMMVRSLGGAADRPAEPRKKPAVPQDFQSLENAMKAAGSRRAAGEGRHLLVSELRVAAIGSAYPIPYEAEVCPFSGIPQPSMNQLDRDGDGITDDWEQKYGLDRYDTGDAQADRDGDGFTNLEEFIASTDPTDASNHPAYAEKLRFIRRNEMPFSLVFQGYTELSDGSTVFQINNPATGKSHFAGVGDVVEGVVVKGFEIDQDGRDHRLYLERDGFAIELARGEIAPDPESQAELINILDRSPIIVTMGALLSLHNDEYVVLGVYSDRVVLKDTVTGKVYDIVGLADGER